MSQNKFEDAIEKRFVSIIQAYLITLGSTAQVFQGESKETDINPRVVVAATQGEESVYQSGIYEITLDISAKVNMDDIGSDDYTNADSSAAVFGAILDVLQMPDLIAQLNNTSTVMVKGTVLGTQRLGEIIERQWQKTASVQVFGFSL